LRSDRAALWGIVLPDDGGFSSPAVASLPGGRHDHGVRDTVALFLLNGRNDYQSDMHRGAVQAARRYGLMLEVHDAATSSELQLQQVRAAVRGRDRDQLLAVLIHPVFDGALEVVAGQAAEAGIGWALLNRSAGYVDELHRLHPELPIFWVSPDQREIGEAQGRVARALLPRGGKVLFIIGPFWAMSARLRRTGLEGVLAGAGVELVQTYGDWSRASGEHAVGRWELMQEQTAPAIPDLVVAQNDAMAEGARRGLVEAARRQGWAELARVPVVGCDGTRDFGMRLVNDGTLAATIVVPGTAAPAIDILEDWRRGRRDPASTTLPVTAYPDLPLLRPLCRR
jgi:ABC-type sugar transport system substrate-binding protein